MEAQEVFNNAPLTEALLDIQVECEVALSMETLESIHDAVKDNFPEKQKVSTLSVTWDMALDKSVSREDEPVGFMFKNPTTGKVFQVRKNGFTFHKLKPYENWDVFVGEAKELWDMYCQAAMPTQVVRFALRYINRVELPMPFDAFDEYLLTGPTIADGIPQALQGLAFRVEIPFPEQEVLAIINEAIEPGKITSHLPLIFDIDVIKTVRLSAESKEIWAIFETLRGVKDVIFFKTFTEKAKALFR